jgi:hypothetical protein
MKKEILTSVKESDIFQRNKGETVKTPKSLQPLPILASIYTDISMEFIMGLPQVGKNSVIMVGVDRLSK